MNYQKRALTIGGSILLAILLAACTKSTEVETTEVTFHPNRIQGYDDFSSAGAAFCCAIDESRHGVMIVALKFDLPLSSATFSPSANVRTTVTGYGWGRANSITEEIVQYSAALQPFMTNVAGIRSMDKDLSVFYLQLSTDQASIEKIYTATEGELKLTRLEGPRDLLEGDLILQEIDQASTDAIRLNPDLGIEINDIYLEWDTATQPE